MRVNAKAYREYSPLVRVNLTQLVANADIIVAIDQERVGCEIVWSTPNVFSTPATRWRHIPGSYSKALPASSFPTNKECGLGYSAYSRRCSLAAKIAVCHNTKMAWNKHFLIGCNEIEGQWGQAFREMVTMDGLAPASLWHAWKCRENKKIFVSPQTRHLWLSITKAERATECTIFQFEQNFNRPLVFL